MPEPHEPPGLGSTVFETGRLVVRPWTHADAENEASLRVCRRLAMEATGSTRKWYGVELESFRIRRPA